VKKTVGVYMNITLSVPCGGCANDVVPPATQDTLGEGGPAATALPVTTAAVTASRATVNFMFPPFWRAAMPVVGG
jgi:hypothetical protein